jgi:hypothetical protein
VEEGGDVEDRRGSKREKKTEEDEFEKRQDGQCPFMSFRNMFVDKSAEPSEPGVARCVYFHGSSTFLKL